MKVRYQVDGDIFREISTNWLCAYVNEYLIKARRFATDQAGNPVEHFQLNDGRVFTRLVSEPQAVTTSSNPPLREARRAMLQIGNHPAT
ncbi:MAG: hypothetical protein ACOYYU_21165 [Chloroflexota bacterium]